MNRISRTMAPAALALSAALTLAACGGSATTTTDTTGAAGASTQAAAPADTAAKVGDSITLADLSKKANDAATKAGSAKVTGTLAGADMTGSISYAPSLAMQMTGSQSGQEIQVIYVDKVLYMGGAAIAPMAGGKKFVKIDANGTDPLSKAMAPMLGTIEQSANPAAMFAGATDVQAKVTKVEGGNVTYSATLTAAQAQEVAKKALAGSGLGDAAAAQIKGMSMEQTLDSQGRPIKVTVNQDGGQSTTMTYSDWGAGDKIAAPPASDVGTASLG